jgi:uncharacterized protein YbjT (DUF2867 family)
VTDPVLLVGGGGFLGRNLATRLIEQGRPVIIVTRSIANAALGSVPSQAQWLECNVEEPFALEDLIRRMGTVSAVVNLVGILHGDLGQPYGASFKAAHVDVVAQLIASMKSLRIRRLIHVSALGADTNGPSMYQRSKGDGENLVKRSGLDWTIFRPSVIFGEQDNFINLFSRLSCKLPFIPLAFSRAKFQPVSVNDVAEAMARSLSMAHTIDRAFDLGGPAVFTLAELVRFAGRRAGCARFVIPMPQFIGKLQAALFEMLPGQPLMSRDNLASMSQDNVLPANASNALDTIFGIAPEPLESLMR